MPTCSTCQQRFGPEVRYCPADGERLGKPAPGTPDLLQRQFRLHERVGQGASGQVYRAHQLGVDRVVAVKVLSPEATACPEFVTRFVREAQTLARLSHPHIISVYNVGHTESEQPFIAMEWVDGAPLGARALSIPEVVEVGVQICSALAHAHAAGVVHRDLKPDNILLREGEDGRPQCKILDFGLARLVNPDDVPPGQSQLTRLGVIYGSPGYLSPEQAGGLAADARSDLYSLGVVLYELLAGRLPFCSSGLSLLVDHLQRAPTPLRQLAPHVPAALAELVMELLEKAPEARPESARAVAARLQSSHVLQSGAALQSSAADEKTSEIRGEVSSFRSRRVSLARRSAAAGLLIAALVALGSGQQRLEATRAPQLAADEVTLPASPEPVPHGPQRALMMSADGYALRVLLPEELHVGAEEGLAVELWGPDDHPLQAPSLVVVFTDSDGMEQALSVPAGAVPGRYELRQTFSTPGEHLMQVFPRGAEVGIQLHFEVSDEPRPRS